MKTVVFACVHNSCRSQMAEAIAKKIGKDYLNVYSAGTEDYPEVKPMAVEVLEEAGFSTEGQYPKLLDDIKDKIDILITMGCNVKCPVIPGAHIEDWGLEDPSGGPKDGFIQCRNLVEEKVINLIERVKNNQL